MVKVSVLPTESTVEEPEIDSRRCFFNKNKIVRAAGYWKKQGKAWNTSPVFLIWIQFNHFDQFSVCFLLQFCMFVVYFNAHVFCHSVFRCILRHRFFCRQGSGGWRIRSARAAGALIWFTNSCQNVMWFHDISCWWWVHSWYGLRWYMICKFVN